MPQTHWRGDIATKSRAQHCVDLQIDPSSTWKAIADEYTERYRLDMARHWKLPRNATLQDVIVAQQAFNRLQGLPD